MEKSWVWRHAPVISAMARSTNRKIMVQACQSKKQDSISSAKRTGGMVQTLSSKTQYHQKVKIKVKVKNGKDWGSNGRVLA
jgi:hypothetical protein